MMKKATEFRIGRVLGRTCLEFARHFLKFSMVSGIGALPWLLLGALTTRNLVLLTLPMLLVAVISMVLSQAVVLLGAFQDLQGRPFSLSGSLQRSFRSILTLVALGLCLGLVLFVPLGAIGYPRTNAGLIAGAVVIALILFFRWSVAMSTCVVEQLGFFRGLSRSGNLIKGYRLKILVLMLIAMAASALIATVVAVALTFAIALGSIIVSGSRTAFVTFGATLSLILLWIATWSAFMAVLFAVLLYELRLAKEGTNTDQIAAVFE